MCNESIVDPGSPSRAPSDENFTRIHESTPDEANIEGSTSSPDSSAGETGSLQTRPLELMSAGEKLAVSITSTLSPILDDVSWRLRTLNESQMELSNQISILLTRLQSYETNTAVPLQLENAVHKLLSIRKRLEAVNYSLTVIEKRVESTAAFIGYD